MVKKLKEKIYPLQPISLILIFIALSVLIILSLVFEYYQRTKEFTKLMSIQTHALLETTDLALKNALVTGREVENQLSTRLLNNAVLIKILLNEGKVNNTLLKKIAQENDILNINIFNNKGIKIFSTQQGFTNQNKDKIYERFYPIFEDLTDTLIIGLREAHINNGFRYIVALATDNNGAIVLVLDGDKVLNFRKKLGFGALLKNLTDSSKICYAVLQDEDGFIAASGNIQTLEDISQSNFLKDAMQNKNFNWRIVETDSSKIFEAVQVFNPVNNIIGLLRIGISAEEFTALNKRFITRLIISGAIIILLGFILLASIFTSQHNLLLKKQYRSIETYSKKVLQNINDGIVVCDINFNIVSINKKAEEVFDPVNDIGKNIFNILNIPSLDLSNVNAPELIKQIELTKNNKNYIFEISFSSFIDENNSPNYIFVFTDLTEKKQLEERINRKDKLSAMGELAGGVAHEIRNPLNTIGTIAQQLNKDFEPVQNKEEYFNLTKLVFKEVKRINQTISDFLKFARPEPIVKEEFELKEIYLRLKDQYKGMFEQKNITFNHNLDGNCTVYWDKNKILQALINVLQNAYDAIKENGIINFNISVQNNKVVIIVEDNGIGIPEDKLNKIFNLYYTTKASGTGIGLSITQRIIYEHDGLIKILSKVNVGTKVTITLPIKSN